MTNNTRRKSRPLRLYLTEYENKSLKDTQANNSEEIGNKGGIGEEGTNFKWKRYLITMKKTNQQKRNKKMTWYQKLAARVLIVISVLSYLIEPQISDVVTPQKAANAFCKDIVVSVIFGNKTLIENIYILRGGTDLNNNSLPVPQNIDSLLAKNDRFAGIIKPAIKEIQYILIQAPYNVAYKVILPDNTLVLLKPGSSIRFPNEFIGDERQIELDGDADFEINHDTKKPFKVLRHKLQVI